MGGFWVLTWTEFKMFLREPYAAFFTLIFPVMLLVLFGSIYGNAPSPVYGGMGFVDAMTPAYAALIIATTGLISLSVTLAANREQGVLRRLRLTPIRPLAVLTAHVLVLFLASLAGLGILVVVGRAVYGLRFPGNVLSMSAGFLLSCAATFAVGFVIAGLVRTARAAQIAAMVLFYPMIFLSGATIPFEVLPAGVRSVARFLPLTPVVGLMRGLWRGDPWSAHAGEAFFLAGIFAVGLIVSARTFRWE